MIVYPVVIPTLCRYEHFKNCVETLSRCTLAEQTELVIGLDFPKKQVHKDGYKKIREYLDTISGFAKITVFTTDVNLGASKNVRRLIDYVYESYDAVIVTEDDNMFSPCFLEFMNKALDEYRDNIKVTSVSGYTAISYYGVTTNPLILTHDYSAWGYGVWKNKRTHREIEYYKTVCRSFKKSFRVFMEYPAVLGMLVEMLWRRERWGDTMYTVDNILDDTYQLRPALSMVRNMGQDGSGLHSGINPIFLSQEISKEGRFEMDTNAFDMALKQFDKITKRTFYLGLSVNRLKAFCQVSNVVVKWVFNRVYFGRK